MNFKLKWSDERWSEQVKSMIDDLRLEAGPFLMVQLRLLLEKVIEFTPPHSKAEGVQRVTSDLAQIVQPFAVDTFRDKRVAHLVETKNFAGFNAFAANCKNPALHNATAIAASDVPALHARVRTDRGRINRGTHFKNFVLGRVDRKALAAYLKRKTDNVGMACAGWLRALYFCGGTSPKWVARHGEEFGSVDASQLKHPDTPYLTATNSTPWANRREEGMRILAEAQVSRVQGMRLWVEAMKRAAKKAGLKVA